MLTDIFSYRYANRTIWTNYSDKERRLIIQTFNLAKELAPYYNSEGKESSVNKPFWKGVHDRISNELGLPSLTQLYYTTKVGIGVYEREETRVFTMDFACQTWAHKAPIDIAEVDGFIKDRISLIEIVFRLKEEELLKQNAELPKKLQDARNQPQRGLRIPGDPGEGVTAWNKILNDNFSARVDELNTRFRQAGCPLHYHNGFVQLSSDSKIVDQIENPFWELVTEPIWKNVDTDMKEALDRRDSGGRDPAFYAARALESAIKIVCDKRAVTTGGEKSAYNYIENLASKRGGNFLADWEAQFLKDFFDKIRNPLGHGPGVATMPSLTGEQTNWAIETCMVWTKSILKRL
jgi:hypothetical protein